MAFRLHRHRLRLSSTAGAVIRGVKLNRVIAVVLFAVALLALAGRRAFPFMDDVPGLVKTAVAVAGALCGLAGVHLWLRKPSGAEGSGEA